MADTPIVLGGSLCEEFLGRVGLKAVHPECWHSIFWRNELRLLLAGYVDDFKLAGSEEGHEEGWKLIGKRIDMDTPKRLVGI